MAATYKVKLVYILDHSKCDANEPTQEKQKWKEQKKYTRSLPWSFQVGKRKKWGKNVVPFKRSFMSGPILQRVEDNLEGLLMVKITKSQVHNS